MMERINTPGSMPDEGDSDSSVGTGYDDEDGVLTKEKREEIAKKESDMVFWLRMLVLAVMLASAITVVVFVYLFMSKNEEEEFQSKFQSAKGVVLESVGRTFDQVLGATDAFVGSLVSHSNDTWPFVAMPDWGYNAAKILKQSKSFHCGLSLLVEPEDTQEWVNFSTSHLDWIEDAKAIQQTDEDWTHSTDFNTTVIPFIWTFHEDLEPVLEPTPYMNNHLVNWQLYPVVQNDGFPLAVNYDDWTIPDAAGGLLESFYNKTVIITNQEGIVYNTSDPLEVLEAEYTANYTSHFLGPDEDPMEPSGYIAYPFFDYADSLNSVRLDRSIDHTPRGYFWYTYMWKNYVQNILPEGTNGVVVVFSSSCAGIFTYRLDGNKATYLGGGDLHDPKYDYMGTTKTLYDIMDGTSQSAEGSSYSGLPVTKTYCVMTLSVYPSQDFEDDYITSEPVIFTALAACIFIFTSLIFIIYDCTVARRQRIVMQRALASGAIVSSLFPEKVKQQLYNEQTQEQKKQNTLKEFMTLPESTDKASINSSKPIADLFDNTTIFFADLAGFTAWSGKRTPVEVFELLENLYGAFDAVAKRRKVFKVETIGDCYVAVTGIPEPQKNHASIMARFACQKCTW
ncbi:Receptor-type guanylate cyclase gcy [Seminavis robusta]|uniref:Receptor-type guanylate cyclase gcy n=1 Tax=Seminavis robusta TaxID=568900 RepID=A0A9N8ES99_9STRA|nr:Receptor-type guanylate cyclase gcy [Seminavis robusta]|eukprot:Sro1799_g298380.1 Receptor-type guanylate cyclase gcy (622) ;mRNA; f:12047-13912